MIGSVDCLRREWKLEKKARETGNEVASPAAFDATLFPVWSDGSCFKRKKIPKLFTKRRKMERTLTS